MQKYVRLRVKDYAEAFDKVKKKDVFEILWNLRSIKKHVRIKQNLYTV